MPLLVLHPDECAGIICIGAGFIYYTNGPRKDEYTVPPANIPAFLLVGKTDENNKEVTARLFPQEQQRKRPMKLVIHPGGHDWGRPEDHEATIKWLDSLWKEPKPAVR